MNFKNVSRWHLPFLLLVSMLVAATLSARATAADKLLIVGDSLSAVYRLPVAQSWPTLLNNKWQSEQGKPTIVNASISGDTAAQGLARLPALLKQHQPRWVLIELGANDGLRGFAPTAISQTLNQIIGLVKQANAEPLLMQIRLPPNYGRRYTDAFYAIYPALAKQNDVPLVPFFMEQVAVKPEWMQDDGLHPAQVAQPFIADLMADKLAPLVK
ncbi:multifunctional acyl-CoA thioesterase I/protease I/lysophospholipase L1 [Ewingella americana]|uniref:multifunctional acyl-CoA thioesterase I/protease I/lysophospholipase L1 n=1 Tax=Ewingella americana TaxID=41202 RepID=UPI00163A7D2B|nr:multifunctional acyl-CoA thioesterase I/protease I/lysophospholipase L1 [Ewingella americana]